MKISKIIITIMTIILMFSICIPVNTFATGINPEDYKPSDPDMPEPVSNITTTIINTISVIGVVLSVIVLIVLGLKYMMGSVSEKADYKKTMIPYLIGVVMVVAITQFLRIIAKLVATVE